MQSAFCDHFHRRLSKGKSCPNLHRAGHKSYIVPIIYLPHTCTFQAAHTNRTEQQLTNKLACVLSKIKLPWCILRCVAIYYLFVTFCNERQNQTGMKVYSMHVRNFSAYATETFYLQPALQIVPDSDDTRFRSRFRSSRIIQIPIIEMIMRTCFFRMELTSCRFDPCIVNRGNLGTGVIWVIGYVVH